MIQNIKDFKLLIVNSTGLHFPCPWAEGTSLLSSPQVHIRLSKRTYDSAIKCIGNHILT